MRNKLKFKDCLCDGEVNLFKVATELNQDEISRLAFCALNVALGGRQLPVDKVRDCESTTRNVLGEELFDNIYRINHPQKLQVYGI